MIEEQRGAAIIAITGAGDNGRAASLAQRGFKLGIPIPHGPQMLEVFRGVGRLRTARPPTLNLPKIVRFLILGLPEISLVFFHVLVLGMGKGSRPAPCGSSEPSAGSPNTGGSLNLGARTMLTLPALIVWRPPPPALDQHEQAGNGQRGCHRWAPCPPQQGASAGLPGCRHRARAHALHDGTP